MTSPFGQKFWFFANYQTAPNPTNPANTHVTSSDIAFWGDLAYVGDYGGFRIFDISQPTPKLVSDMRCYGPQGDPSVFDRNGDGRADTLVLSVDSVAGGPGMRRRAGRQERDTGRYPDGAWEGIRIFDISNPWAPKQIATVYQDCGSHTNTLLPAPGGQSMYVLNSSYPLGEGPTCGPLGAQQGRKVNHGVVQVVEMPFRDPTAARELTELPIVYPGDADGTYKPVSEHGIVAPLDDFLGCHDLSSFPALGHRRRGVRRAGPGVEHRPAHRAPDTANPRWAYDQPNVDFWHSATFSWDGKVANFIDESFGDGCPTVTTKTGGLPAAEGIRDRQHVLLRDQQRRPALGVPQPAADQRQREPDDRQVLLVAPRHPGAGAGPLPARERVLPRRLVGDRLQRPDEAEGDRVRRHGRHQHVVGVHLPAPFGQAEQHPRLLQRRPEPQLRHGGGSRAIRRPRTASSASARRSGGRS